MQLIRFVHSQAHWQTNQTTDFHQEKSDVLVGASPPALVGACLRIARTNTALWILNPRSMRPLGDEGRGARWELTCIPQPLGRVHRRPPVRGSAERGVQPGSGRPILSRGPGQCHWLAHTTGGGWGDRGGCRAGHGTQPRPQGGSGSYREVP